MLLRPAARQLERIFKDAIDARAREYRLLYRRLALRALEHPPADRGVFAFGVLAHDGEIDIADRTAGERRAHPGHEPHRTNIGILLEAPANRDEQSPERNVIGHRRKPDRAEKDRVVMANLFEPVFRHHASVFGVVLAAPWLFVPREANAEPAGRGLKYAHAFRHNFFADAVAWN